MYKDGGLRHDNLENSESASVCWYRSESRHSHFSRLGADGCVGGDYRGASRRCRLLQLVSLSAPSNCSYPKRPDAVMRSGLFLWNCSVFLNHDILYKWTFLPILTLKMN